jgi:tetratricopeptide (TPR) repeat protein
MLILVRSIVIMIIIISFFPISLIKFGDVSAQGPESITDDVDALSDKGAGLDSLGQYEEAIEYYDTALAIDPNHVNALYNKGVALGNLGRYQDAIEYYDKVLALEPNNVGALNNKANAIVSLGESCPPGEELNSGTGVCEPQPVTIPPDTEPAPQNETEPTPPPTLPTEPTPPPTLPTEPTPPPTLPTEPTPPPTLPTEPTPPPTLPTSPAPIDEGEGDCPGDLEFNPDNSECECPLGSLRDGDECFPDVEGGGGDEEGGGGDEEGGGGDEEGGGGDEEGGGGDEEGGGGDEEDGVQPVVYQEAQLLAQTTYDFLNGAEIESVSGNPAINIEQSIKLYDRALSISPNDVDILVNKGVAFLKLNRYQEANQVFDQALSIDPQHVGCLYNKGVVLEKLGKSTEAAEYKDRAQSIDPTYAGESINKPPAVSELKSVF